MLLIGSIFLSILSYAQIKMPAPSPSQTIIQDFGLSKLEITYSRPSIKGRKIFKDNSELAPIGKVWRTGANFATKIKILDPVEIAGKAVDTGTYAIYTIPNKNEWTLIINKESKKWGTQYNQEGDLFRVPIPVHKLKESVEVFTIQFANVKAESCDLQLIWSNVSINIPITTNIKEKIRTQIEKALKADSIQQNTYNQAANFYYEYDKDYAKALFNITKAIDGKTDKFWLWLLKAKIERDMGDKTAAKASAETCKKSAAEQKNEDYQRAATELINKL